MTLVTLQSDRVGDLGRHLQRLGMGNDVSKSPALQTPLDNSRPVSSFRPLPISRALWVFHFTIDFILFFVYMNGGISCDKCYTGV